MIRLLKREQIDEKKYNNCISNSFESRIFAYSWYLDVVIDSWGALVLNNYEAVMPLPTRKKYGIKYIYPPFWLIELGVFTSSKNVSIISFIEELFRQYRFVELRLNTDNNLTSYHKNKEYKTMQVLSLKDSYQHIFNNYNRNRKRELKKAKTVGLVEKWNDTPERLITLYKNNVGKRVAKIKEKDYVILYRIMQETLKRGVGELLSIYDSNQKIVGATFYLKHKNTVTNLVSTTDFNNRNNGVNTFFNDRAIFNYQQEFEEFHFGGSSMEGIANYYKSFGAITKKYYLLKKTMGIVPIKKSCRDNSCKPHD